MYGAISGMSGVVALLPYHLKKEVEKASGSKWDKVEEIRLRIGRKISVVVENEEHMPLNDIGADISRSDLLTVLELASQSSVHTVLERVKQGFVTIAGGHRIGICGNVVALGGQVENYRYISSLSLRVAHEKIGVARPIITELYCDGELENTLIIAPPGMGKTTLLRDLIRGISDGDGVDPLRVGLVDERGEVAAMWEGVPQFDVGSRTDVMDGCAKSVGVTMLLRGMNPQILCVDEITVREDVGAIMNGFGCGVKILATTHGSSVLDIKKRGIYKELVELGVFSKAITIGVENGSRSYTVSEFTRLGR